MVCTARTCLKNTRFFFREKASQPQRPAARAGFLYPLWGVEKRAIYNMKTKENKLPSHARGKNIYAGCCACLRFSSLRQRTLKYMVGVNVGNCFRRFKTARHSPARETQAFLPQSAVTNFSRKLQLCARPYCAHVRAK